MKGVVSPRHKGYKDMSVKPGRQLALAHSIRRGSVASAAHTKQSYSAHNHKLTRPCSSPNGVEVVHTAHRNFIAERHRVYPVADVECVHGEGDEVVHVLVRVLHPVACDDANDRERMGTVHMRTYILQTREHMGTAHVCGIHVSRACCTHARTQCVSKREFENNPPPLR